MIILRREFENRNIQIDPLETEDKEEVCADLHIGATYLEAGSSENLTMPATFNLKAGRCIIVQTKERLAIPGQIFGTLYSRGSLAARGMLVANTKIDPHFNGELKIAIFNAGNQTIEIKKNDPFCSIVFHELSDRIASPRPRGGPNIGNEKKGKILRFLEDNIAHVATIIIAIVGAAVATIITMKYSVPVPQPNPINSSNQQVK